MKVELFLIRHAATLPAEEREAGAGRPLSERGRKRFARCVSGLRAMGVRWDVLLHSPRLQAVETAELCTELLRGESIVCAALAEPPRERWFAELARLGDPSSVALVGHEPWIGELCALCSTGQVEHGRAFAFKKGGVAWLTGEPLPGRMSLRGFFSPRVFRRA